MTKARNIFFSLSLTLMLLAFGSLTVSAQSKGIVVEIKKEVAVKSQFIKLSEIAVLSGDEKLVSRVSAEHFGRCPKGKSSKTVTLGEIRSVMQLLGIPSRKIEFRGADSVRVYNGEYVILKSETESKEASTDSKGEIKASDSEASGQETKAEDKEEADKEKAKEVSVAESIRKALNGEKAKEDEAKREPEPLDKVNIIERVALESIRADAAKQLKLDVEDVAVETTRVNNKLKPLLNQRGVLLEYFNSNYSVTPLGEHAFKLVVSIEGNEISDLVLTVNISRMVKVVVAKHDLRRGTLIDTTQLSLERRPFTTKVENYYTSTDDIKFMAPKANLKAGEVVEPSDLVPAKIVERGDKVKVSFANGAIALTIYGAEAKQSGGIGEIIALKYKMKDSEGKDVWNSVSARITAPGEAVVE